MAASSQKIRPTVQLNSKVKPKVGSWEATFPPKQETAADSLLFMQRMVFVSFSHVLKMRAVLPKSCFKRRKIEETKVNIINVDGGVVAKKMTTLLRGACDAIERRYLRELVLVLNGDASDPDSAVEAYTMTVGYSADSESAVMQFKDAEGKSLGPEIVYRGSQHVRKATCGLLDRLTDTLSRLAPMPDNIKPTIRITYYDEVTPDDYEPPGFVPCNEKYHFKSSTSVGLRKLGKVDTKMHGCHLKVESEYLENLDEGDEPMDFTIDTDHALVSKKLRAMCTEQVAATSSTDNRRGLASVDVNIAANRLASTPKRLVTDEGFVCMPVMQKELNKQQSQRPLKKRPVLDESTDKDLDASTSTVVFGSEDMTVLDHRADEILAKRPRPKMSVANQRPRVSTNRPFLQSSDDDSSLLDDSTA